MSTTILHFELTTPVEDNRPIYISGNFNDWAPDKEDFRLQKQGEGLYALHYPISYPLPDMLEYKYTKGGWDQVELDEFGHPSNNRVLNTIEGKVQDFVPHWRMNGANLPENVMPEIHLISDEFEMPQLQRKRAVYILLPKGYERSKKHYPVLYLQDAQDLFGGDTEMNKWGIDKQMAILAARGHGDVIIVAIAHGGEDRFAEYSPYNNPKLGKGEGRKYIHFLTRTLKPYIDKNYRTIPTREATGIGGSSLAGLISIYAGLMAPELFGRLMIFSPSLWVSPNIYFDAIDFLSHLPAKLYVYVGEEEGEVAIQNVEKLKQTLERQGKKRIEIQLSVDPSGEQSQMQWGKEFPKAVEWLYF